MPGSFAQLRRAVNYVARRPNPPTGNLRANILAQQKGARFSEPRSRVDFTFRVANYAERARGNEAFFVAFLPGFAEVSCDSSSKSAGLLSSSFSEFNFGLPVESVSLGSATLDFFASAFSVPLE